MSELLAERDGELLVLTLNRPDRRNALTDAMFVALDAELARAADDRSIRAVIVTGAGTKAFSAGLDFATMAEVMGSQPTREQLRGLIRRWQDAFSRLEELDRPTIAAIEGSCLGAGFELALACDFRVIATEAKLGLPEVKLGFLPDLGGPTRLARLAGPSVAKSWVMTGRHYSPVQALEHGLVQELVVPGDALTRAKALGLELAANGPLALGWAKRVIDGGYGLSTRASLELERDANCEILTGPEPREGIAAAMEKRPPKFR